MVSDNLLRLAAQGYGFDVHSLRFVTETAKQFYGFEKQDRRYMLRLAKGDEGLVSQTRAEMDWVWYLAEQGISVTRPLKAVDGRLALPAEDGGEAYAVCACEVAQGRRWDTNDPELWNEKVFYQWGKVMGDIHRATKDYVPANERDRRPEFTSIIGDSVGAFPAVDRAAKALIGEIMALPRDRDAYGLIHYDLGQPNFMIDGERINVFDFADCAYGWFALDIGVALTLGLWFGRCNDAGYDFTGDIIRHFLRGYLSVHHLSGFWLGKVPAFMRLCQIAAFSITQQREDPDDAHQQELIYNIENHVFLTGCEIDYSMFAGK